MNEISLANSSTETLKKYGALKRSDIGTSHLKEPNLFICGIDIKMTKNQLAAITLLSLNFFFNWAYYSLFAPFFPEEAIKKGMNTTQIGIIFGVFQLILMIFTPIFGKYMNAIGVKFLLTGGLFLGAGSMALFGFVAHSPPGLSYFLVCLAARTVTALGTSMGLNYAIVGYFFPDKIASIVAVLEIFTGFGLMIGPVIGGILFEIGGFKLPFFTMAALTGLLLIFTLLLFPDPDPISQSNPSKTVLPMLPLLKIPKFILTLFMLFCGSLSINFIEPSIQIHLLPFNLTPFELGLIFFVPAFIYVIVTPFVGYLCDKFPKSMPWFMMISAVFSALSYCFFGPLPWLNLKLRLSTFVGGYVLFGASFSGLIVPVYAELVKIAEFYGYPKDLRTQGLISGLFSCVYSLGALIGPIIGGFVVDLIGFDMATFIIVILFVITGSFYSVAYFYSDTSSSKESVLAGEEAYLINEQIDNMSIY